MKPELLEFLSGHRSVVKDEFVLSREKCELADYYYVSLPDLQDNKPVYLLSGWAKRIKRQPVKTVDGQTVPTKPKHTGGKAPYVMLMQNNIEDASKLSFEAWGVMSKLLALGHIEWVTGRIIHRRSKHPLTINEIGKVVGCKPTKTKRIMAQLTKHGIFKYDRKDRCYIADRTYIKKGGVGK